LRFHLPPGGGEIAAYRKLLRLAGGDRRLGQMHEPQIGAHQHADEQHDRDRVGDETAQNLENDAALGPRAGLPALELQQLIVEGALLRVAQDGVGTHDIPEPRGGSGIAAAQVGVARLGGIAVRILQRLGIVGLIHAEQVIKGDHGVPPRMAPPASARVIHVSGTRHINNNKCRLLNK